MSSADQNRLVSSIKTSKLHKTNFVVDGRCPEHEHDRNVVENHPCVTDVYSLKSNHGTHTSAMHMYM